MNGVDDAMHEELARVFDDRQEAVSAFVEKRAPRYNGE